MPTLAGLDYVQLDFNKDGSRHNPGGAVYPAGVTDLIVISHGWHQDAPSSQQMYTDLIGKLVTEAGASWSQANRTFGVCGIFWPSDKFRDDLGQETFNIVGGQAASVGGDLNQQVLEKQAFEFAAFLGIQDPDFVKLAVNATHGGGDADDLADEIRKAIGPIDGVDDDVLRDHHELMTKPGHQLVDHLKVQPVIRMHANVGGGGQAAAMAGGGGHAMGIISGVTTGVATLLNQFAYFELKKRSAVVGTALGQFLDGAPGIAGVRIHLVGHSFGGRLVTAAAAVMHNKPASMCLLQAAFSHNAFGKDLHYSPIPKFTGGFRKVIEDGKVTGPIAVTHTWNDRAVGLAYPAASRVSQSIASAFGGLNALANLVSVSDHFGGALDVYGGLGSNGALGLSAAEATATTFDGTSALVLAKGHVTSLKCEFITEHTDIRKVEVARVLRAAMA